MDHQCSACVVLPPKAPHAHSHPLRNIDPPRVAVRPPSAVPNAPTAVPTASPTLVRHYATCDLCDKHIYDVRNHCLSCPDWDACAECFRSIHDLHPKSHSFVQLKDPKAIVRPASSVPSPTHFGILCDGCEKPIKGIRYKCTDVKCRDFDLCEACEAIGVDTHDRNHLMLKIRMPQTSAGLQHGMAIGRSLATAPTTAPKTSAPSVVRTEYRPATAVGGDSTLIVDLDLGDHIDLSATPREIHIPIKLPAGAPKIVGSLKIVGETAAKTFDERFPPLSPASPGVAEAKTESTSSIDQGPVKQERSPLPTDFTSVASLIENEIFKVTENVKGQVAIGEDVFGKFFGGMKRIVDDFNVALTAPGPAPVPTPTPEAPVVSVADSGPEVETKEAPQMKAEQVSEAVTSPQLTTARFAAKFVTDVTVPDQSVLPPGAMFSKVWKLANTGTEAWPEGCKLTNVGGWGKGLNDPNAASTVPPAAVRELVDVTIHDLKAPDESGHYLSFWRLVNIEGEMFGDRLWIE